MRYRMDRERPARTRRGRVVAIAALASGLVVAGCGGSSLGPTPTPTPSTAARAGAASTGASTDASAASSGSNVSPAGAPNALAFARCMRANGVPNFPDPSAGGGFMFSTTGINPAAPAVRAASARCRRFAPQPPGSGGASFSPRQQAQALARLRQVAQCMREHGISDFPDPRTSRPPNLNLGEYSEITDYMGVFLLFPSTIDMQSPAWDRAAAACGPLAESLNHSHR